MLSNFEKEQIWSVVETAFPGFLEEHKDAMKDYEQKTSSPVMKTIYSTCTGYIYNETNDNVYNMGKTIGIFDNPSTKKALLEACNFYKPDTVNISAIVSFELARRNLFKDKAFQNDVNTAKEKVENLMNEEDFQMYAYNTMLIRKWVDETYEDTIWKDLIYAQIDELEKELNQD